MARVRANSALRNIITDCRKAELFTEAETAQIDGDVIEGLLSVSTLKIINAAWKKLPRKPSLRQALLSLGRMQHVLILREKLSEPETKTV
jgi:hypothetical protein